MNPATSVDAGPASRVQALVRANLAVEARRPAVDTDPAPPLRRGLDDADDARSPCISAIRAPKSGMPQMKLFVPSIGSSTHRTLPLPRHRNSSP